MLIFSCHKNSHFSFVYSHRSEGTLTSRSASAYSVTPTPSDYNNADYDDDDEEEQGRIPTPQLRNTISATSVTPQKSHSKPRHHLARTTPTVGGAMLTAPQSLGVAETESSVDSYRPIAGQSKSDPVLVKGKIFFFERVLSCFQPHPVLFL